MLFVPRVAIKGTIPRTVTVNPLKAPNAIPVRSPRLTAIGTEIP